MQKALYIVDCITTTIFGLEALLKIISLGFLVNGSDSYLRNPWNQLDSAILVLSILSLTPMPDSLKIFKIFRVLRILRLIGRNESLKVGLQALIYALPNMMNVLIIMLFFFIMFGILYVSYFKGKMYDCRMDQIGFDVLDGAGKVLDI